MGQQRKMSQLPSSVCLEYRNAAIVLTIAVRLCKVM